MKCLCGYQFLRDDMTGKKDEVQSFAVIDEAVYQDFLKAEIKANETKAVEDEAMVSQYVGTIDKCPECGVIRIAEPEGESPVFYTRQGDAE